MPLKHFLYRCPRCEQDPLEGAGDRAWCRACGFAFARGGEGGRIRLTHPSGAVEEVFGHTLAAGMEPGDVEKGKGPSRKARVSVRRAAGREGPVRHAGEVVGFAEELGEPREGSLEITSRALILWDGEDEGRPPMDQWALADIRAVQTTSSALQVSPATGGVVLFRFEDDSPRRWEELLHRRLREGFRKEGRGEILEFQPRIVASGDATFHSGAGESRRRYLPRENEIPWSFREPRSWELSWYGFFRRLLGLLTRLATRTTVKGLENIPASGPFILVANHQSLLDPILVQVACPRPIHTLTKSTQFSGGFFRWLLPRLNAIPTRRYCIEPQAVRVMIRRLAEGRGVGIYPEGERSWDGVLQPFRRGTIRFLLRAGVPVVPCGISGAYDAWPRWSRKVRRRRVRVTFGPPLDWPTVNSRWEADARVEEAALDLKELIFCPLFFSTGNSATLHNMYYAT